MLAQLHIRNLAVIDEVELQFASGFAVLTGETGAGKSILFDALDLCLGGRADPGAIRSGASRAEISALFLLSGQPAVLEQLRQQDLDEGDECQLRRVIGSDGRSRGYVNGRSVPLQVLRDLGELLVDICGQQAHQSLRQRAAQRALLDAHGGHQVQLATVAAAHATWQQEASRLDALANRSADTEAHASLLRHQVDEIQALDPQPGELARLERERLVVSHAARLIEGLNMALFRLDEQEGAAALDGVSASRRLLDELHRYDPALAQPLALLGEAEIQLQEAVATLRDRLHGLEHDPARQEELEDRVAALRELSRKHRVEADELPALRERLAAELAGLDDSGERLKALEARCAALRKTLGREASVLTKVRGKAARALAEAVNRNLAELGMPAARFSVRLDPVPNGEVTAQGAERVEFLVSTNPGQAAGPVARVASGGELSRLNLAIQVSALGNKDIPTLLFDEVDAGVGGGIAEIVGRKLRELSTHAQVLCVTHLPQVASQATRHYRVSKAVQEDSTRTSVALVDDAARLEEIARMLGGLEITAQTRAHAREMLRAAR